MKLSFSGKWRLWLKFIGITVAAVLLLFTVTSWIVFRQRNALILEQLQAALTKSQSGQLFIGAIDLRFFRSFPDITIELDSIYYYEHHDSMRTEQEQPILQADRIFLALELWPLFNNQVAVSEVSVSGGTLNFIEYAPGVFNIHRALERPKKPSVGHVVDTSEHKKPIQKPKAKPATKKPASPPGKPLSVDLENISLQDVSLAWLPLHVRHRNHLLIRTLEADLSQSDSQLEIDLRSHYHVDTVQAGKITLPQGEVHFNALGTFDIKEKRLFVSQTELKLEDFSITAIGSYEHNKQGMLDVQVNATSDDLPLLERMMRKEVLQSNRDLLGSGAFYIKGKVWGHLREAPPQFDFTFGVSNLSFRLPGNAGAFEDLGFDGSLSSGVVPDYSEAAVYLKQIRGKVPGGSIDGDVRISNLVSPWLQCNVQSQLTLDGFDKAFQISSVQELEGKVALRLRFDGPMRLPWPGNKGPKSKFDATFSISDLSFLIGGNKQFSGIGCAGTFTSGPNPDQSEAVLAIPELKATVPGGHLAGSLRITNLNEPLLHYRFGATVDLNGYDEVLNLKAIRNLRGRASADLRFDGPLQLIGTHAMDSSRKSTFRLDSVSFEHVRSKRAFTYLQATLENQNNIADLALDMRCGESDVQLKASFENLMHRIFSHERVVSVSGKVTSTQFHTKDFIFDTLQVPIVKDRISNFSMDFNLRNGLAREDSLMDRFDILFDIKNLVARLDKLADIRKMDAQGVIRNQSDGISLDLQEFHLTTPQGRADISGKMNLPGRRQLDAQAQVRLTNFPWAYVDDLIAEIRDGAEPKRKNLPGKFDYVTANLDLAASMRTYPFDFHQLEIRNSRFLYYTSKKEPIGVDRMEASLRPFSFIHPSGSGTITGLKRLQGNMDLKGLRLPGFSDIQTSLKVAGIDDSLQVDFLSPSKAKRDGGSIFLNLASAEPHLTFHYAVEGAQAADVVSKFSTKKFLTGDIGYTLEVTTRGNTWQDAKQNLAGSVEIKSDSLLLYGIDMDDALTKFQKSQKFNLADLGAVMLVGPVGIVATKGTDFVVLSRINVDNTQKTHIRKLFAHWNLERMLLSTTDVAFATEKNRIAFNGSLDFESDSIPGVVVAVVDKNGCSLMDQKLHGKFSSIQTGKLNVAKTVLGSVINFVDVLVGKDCKPVYTGQVKHPQKKS